MPAPGSFAPVKGSQAACHLGAVGHAGHPARSRPGRTGWRAAQARILAFSRSNSSAVMTPRSRRSASLASWSAVLCEPAACWT